MIKLSAVLFLSLITLAVICVVQGCFKNEDVLTKEKLDQVLKVDLPVGTSKENVEAYLKSKNYDYGPDEKGLKISAMARNIDKGMITFTNVHIVFDFGKDGKLTGFTTEKILTGP